MKKLFIVLCCLVFVSCNFMGCDIKSQESYPVSDIQNKNLKEITRNEEKKLKGVILQTRGEIYSLKSKEIFFDLYNHSDHDISYGRENYTLDLKIGDKWYGIPPGGGAEFLFTLPPQANMALIIDFSMWKSYDFAPGRYRLVFSQGEEWTAKEFDLVE